jgi:DNA-binding transcriptional LysR family regulator
VTPAGVDTNLFVVLAALLEERTVAGAARRIGLSPSAASHALQRLRRTLDDALLVRVGTKLVLTDRARALVEPSRRLMRELETILGEPTMLAPAELRRDFRLATSDHVLAVMLPELERRLARLAPHVKLHVHALGARSLHEVKEGDVDAAAGVFGDLPAALAATTLFHDQLVATVRAGHPEAGRKLSLQQFARMRHVLVAPYGTPIGLVDALLADRGLSREIARVLPAFFAAPIAVAHSDCVATLPERFIQTVERPFKLQRLRIAAALPRFTVSLVWHRRHDRDPEHAWLRDLLAATGRDA